MGAMPDRHVGLLGGLEQVPALRPERKRKHSCQSDVLVMDTLGWLDMDIELTSSSICHRERRSAKRAEGLGH